ARSSSVPVPTCFDANWYRSRWSARVAFPVAPSSWSSSGMMRSRLSAAALDRGEGVMDSSILNVVRAPHPDQRSDAVYEPEPEHQCRQHSLWQDPLALTNCQQSEQAKRRKVPALDPVKSVAH